jgi:hypothetical protein
MLHCFLSSIAATHIPAAVEAVAAAAAGVATAAVQAAGAALLQGLDARWKWLAVV